jgi:NADPH:quinone reductase-like Zn-dependent oxidoreductase
MRLAEREAKMKAVLCRDFTGPEHLELGEAPDPAPADDEIMAARLAKQTLMQWVADGKIRPHVGMVLPLERIGEAMAAIGARTSSGRVVMKIR